MGRSLGIDRLPEEPAFNFAFSALIGEDESKRGRPRRQNAGDSCEAGRQMALPGPKRMESLHKPLPTKKVAVLCKNVRREAAFMRLPRFQKS